MDIRNLTNESELDQLLSQDGPVWVLKHSNTCPVSTYAKHEFDSYLDQNDDIAAGIVVVQESRDLSNKIAKRFNVTHESPQALLFVDGQVKWHVSHGGILAQELEDALAEQTS